MTSQNKSFTDVIYQEFRLYIEGIQVPFESIVISTSEGQLPVASISVPVQAGLMDIARFYRPKVHVFFYDRIKDDSDEKKRWKLFFTGHIHRVRYSKSVSGGGGNASISFECQHKNALIRDCLIDYSGWLKESTDPRGESVVKESHANSQASIIEALFGIEEKYDSSKEITEANPDGETRILPSWLREYTNRLLGIPGVIINYWNQLNRTAFNKELKSQHDGFTKMYKPLIEVGLDFFRRIAGHYILERQIQNDRVQPCPENPGKYGDVIAPPSTKLFLKTAAQAQITVASLQNYLQTSGEITDIYSIIQSTLDAMDYDLLTLNAPAEAPMVANPNAEEDQAAGDAGATEYGNLTSFAVETVIKPRIPFYFSPTCNVLMPNMFTNMEVEYNEGDVPTRVDAKTSVYPDNNQYPTHFRAPHSIRAAVADGRRKSDSTAGRNLASTMGPSYGVIGKFEQGCGVKVGYIEIPRWLSHLSMSAYGGNNFGSADSYPDKDKDPLMYESIQQLKDAWTARYPASIDAGMNPWAEKDPGIAAHQRLLFAAADYYYTRMFAASKRGSVSCPFNPYIVAGYPMDIIEANPLRPSFHAHCLSVTHTITSRSVSTDVQFVAAMTYSELANYYIPFVQPYLQVALGLTNNQTLVYNSEGKAIADDFYYYTLGCTSAAPEDIYDFDTGSPKPVRMGEDGKWTLGSADSLPGENGGEMNPALTYEGNLALTYRPVESLSEVEDRTVMKFVDMTIENYNPVAVEYTDSVLSDASKLEIGQSQFLDYQTYFGTPYQEFPTDSSGEIQTDP